MLVAVLALVASVAGAGYAAVKINGNQIKKNSIPGKALKNETIKGKKIKNGSITAADLAPGAASPSARSVSVPGAVQVGNNPTFVTVATLSGVAAGEYAISGKANVEPNPLGGAEGAQVICRIAVNGVEIDRSLVQIGENAATTPTTLRAALPVQGAAVVPAGGTITLDCAKGGASIEIDASQRQLMAIAVNLP